MSVTRGKGTRNVAKRLRLYKGDKTCPTETIFQIGDVDKCADPETLRKCYVEYMRAIQDWSSKHGGHFHILDYAMHFDEKTPHVH